MLAALAQHAPGVLAAATEALEGVARGGRRISPAAEPFSSAPAISVDRGVMEKSDRVAVVPVAMGWSDVGSWDSLYEQGSRDKAGNSIAGDVLALDVDGCLLRSEGPLLVAIGVSDLIVVATKDALVVVPRGDSQRISEAYALLERRADPRR
jgi:mannose-1-phosphate guanylyltransferase/mannose-1-phosphate guanylyltransferase/mannose-6-phosphate isomerase